MCKENPAVLVSIRPVLRFSRLSGATPLFFPIVEIWGVSASNIRGKYRYFWGLFTRVRAYYARGRVRGRNFDSAHKTSGEWSCETFPAVILAPLPCGSLTGENSPFLGVAPVTVFLLSVEG